MSPADVLLVLLVDVLIPSLFAAAAELVRERRGGLDPETGSSGQVATGTLFAIVGGVTGLFSALVFPHPLWQVMPGASLLVTPVGVGLIMHLFGVWRSRRGSYPSLLASFWGGALFGLSAALVRFLVIHFRGGGS